MSVGFAERGFWAVTVSKQFVFIIQLQRTSRSSQRSQFRLRWTYDWLTIIPLPMNVSTRPGARAEDQCLLAEKLWLR